MKKYRKSLNKTNIIQNSWMDNTNIQAEKIINKNQLSFYWNNGLENST